MSLGHGPKIITDGLVFAYDMGPNPGVNKSWKGKPTTNLLIQSTREHTGGMGSYWSGVINANNTERGFPSFKITTVNNDRLDGFITSNGGNLTNGVTYTWSADAWVPTGKTIQIRIRNITGGGSRSGSALNISGSNSWVRVSKTFTADTNTAGMIEGNEQNSVTDVYSFWVKNLQLEQNSFATPFVNGTRSNTQALLDWTGNNTITINGLTYNSDGTFSYYGTNGTGLSLPGTNFSLNAQTIECWCYASNFVQNGFMFEKTTNGSVNTQYSFFFNNNSSGHVYYRTVGLTPRDQTLSTSNSGVVNNQWNHMVATFDGSTKRIYVNGVQKTSASTTGTITANTTGAAYIGTYGSFAGYPFNGQIGVTKIYNRALTAAEVAQNFQALRGRYGI